MRIDSGDPSKPERLASTTSGRLPLVALIARAIFLEPCGKSVLDVQRSGPSAGMNPGRDRFCASNPSRQTGHPPR